MTILSVQDVVLARGSFRLGPISLDVGPGELVGLVGPNGAGKTTLISLLMGELTAADGMISVCGELVDLATRQHLRHIGYVPDDNDLILGELSAREIWRLTAEVHQRAGGRSAGESIARAEEVASALGFNPPKRPSSGYSHGMRKKTQIVAALATRPQVLIVDELRNGLDPIAGRLVERVLHDERERGVAVLAASHDLPWAERVADRVVVLAEGRAVAIGSIPQILAKGETSLEDAFFRLIGATA